MLNKKSFIAVFLLALFIYPQVEKFAHTHHLDKKARFQNTSKCQINEAQEECTICDFEFSIFQVDILSYNFCFDIQKEIEYLSSYRTIVLDACIHHSLRGPPLG